MTSTAMFVGVDIAKTDFVVACRPDSTSWTALNDVPGITGTVNRVCARSPQPALFSSNHWSEESRQVRRPNIFTLFY